MNIEKIAVDSLNAELVIQIEPKDYADRYEQALKKYRKNAQLPGFRPGHVPASLIKQRYGKALLAEEMNTVLQDAIYSYINENKLEVLGNPIPKDQEEVGNWDNPENFKFIYELGLAPQFELELNASKKYKFHVVDVNEDLVNRQVKDYARRFGKMSEPEISGEEDMLLVELHELNENNEVLEGGITSKSTVSIEYIKDAATKSSLVGLKNGDTVNVNPHFLSENHEDLAKMLGITHHQVHHLSASFHLTVSEIKHMEAAELNQELFDKLFEAGTITSEEQMKERVKSDLENAFKKDSEWMFKRDFAIQIVDETTIQLPDNFLKRWITLTNEKAVTPEALELEYPMYAQSLRWQLIENKLIQKYELKVSGEDAINHVKEVLRGRFAQYGLPVEDDRLTEMARETLSKKEEAKGVFDALYESKIMEVVMANCTIENVKLNYDEFVHRIQH